MKTEIESLVRSQNHYRQRHEVANVVREHGFNHLMPGFFDKMPAKKSGQWKAIVEIYNFRKREIVYCKRTTGLRRAYVRARIVALWWDLWQPSWRGIDWAVKECKGGKQ
jgi:hypothetical protein